MYSRRKRKAEAPPSLDDETSTGQEEKRVKHDEDEGINMKKFF